MPSAETVAMLAAAPTAGTDAMSIAALQVAALLALLPLAGEGLRQRPGRDRRFWLAVAAGTGMAALPALLLGHGLWHPGFIATLWATIAVTIGLYGVIAGFAADAWRLAPLVGAYMLGLAALAVLLGLVSTGSAQPMPIAGAWFGVHLVIAMTTYALVTIAAIAATAALLQETALKRKRPTGLTRRLPSIARCESLTIGLLAIGEVVLGAGLATGMAVTHVETGELLPLNHKTVLTLAAFFVLGGLLAAHYGTGVRGRQAVRMVLLGYLLLTLGYPGVKFIRDILIG